MGKTVMPKNTALRNEVEAALRIYYEANDWIENNEYTAKLKTIIGDSQYPSSYTKKAQIPAYFGFIEWENPTNKRSRKRITDIGKCFYDAIINNDENSKVSILLESLESTIFGRNNCGASDSDSDAELPCIFIRAVLDIDYLTYNEFAQLRWLITDINQSYETAVLTIKKSRVLDNFTLSPDAKNYTDAKPIAILIRWGFLTEVTEDTARSKKIRISNSVLEQFKERLYNLSIYNVTKLTGIEKNTDNLISESLIQEELIKNCKDIELSPRSNNLHPLNCICYGAPGTGKTYSTVEYALAIVENKEVDLSKKSPKQRKVVMEKYKSLVKSGQVAFTTFHQNYGYEDFIEGLRPDAASETLSFLTIDGVFKKLANAALNDAKRNYVIIIDEINRANISKVFGELITLIEEDKRWGELNETSATLPSGEVFAVPNNLYIVGTMNSADKSISLIDTALRHRFEFIEQIPDASLVENSTLKNILEKLNEKLVEELDSTDLLIGHSYFLNKNEKDLGKIFNNSIIPLLYEYFYDNRKKVAAILRDITNQLDVEIVDSKIGRLNVRNK